MQNGNGAAVPGSPAATARRVSVLEAARILAIGERAVRWRIQKGLLAAERDGHGWRVLLPPDAAGAPAPAAAENGNGAAAPGNPAATDQAPDSPLSPGDNPVVTEVAWLRAEVERLHERLREAHVLLAQRPALPAAVGNNLPTEPAVAVLENARTPRPWYRHWARWAWWR